MTETWGASERSRRGEKVMIQRSKPGDAAIIDFYLSTVSWSPPSRSASHSACTDWPGLGLTNHSI